MSHDSRQSITSGNAVTLELSDQPPLPPFKCGTPDSPGPLDLASFKLLRHLQSRVKQLCAENQAYACSLSTLGRAPMELARYYLETDSQS
ncbi:hypothetical protein J4Q44_G00232700 [Coregonus suidteri]|uniref:Uncharacterized protein n=1 Tax=Coregonus suidteri TaxID=861788 RepID=A0AAN8LAY4_9TELE